MRSDVYVIDTSSWIRLSREHPVEPSSDIWRGIYLLIQERRILSPRAVHGEVLARNDALRKWLDCHKKAFVAANSETLRLVAEIDRRCPGLVDHSKSRVVADPYLIAVAMMLKAGLARINPLVVTEESNNPSRITKIPQVAQKYGISCINASKMLKREGLQ